MVEGLRGIWSLKSLFVLLSVLVALCSGAEVCEADEAGQLRPNHLKDMPVYKGFHLNHTVTLASQGREGSFQYVPGATLQVAEGAIDHRGVDGESSFSVLTGVVTQEEGSYESRTTMYYRCLRNCLTLFTHPLPTHLLLKSRPSWRWSTRVM